MAGVAALLRWGGAYFTRSACIRPEQPETALEPLVAPGQSILTTQLYLPGGSRNATDSLFNPLVLLHDLLEASGDRAAILDAIL